MKQFLTAIFSIYAMVVFVVVMLLLFPFFIVASFMGPIKGGNMVFSICRIWADIVLFLWGVKHRNIYKHPILKSEPAIFVFNHISYIDIPLLMKIFRNMNIRILGKAEMAKIPLFGFIYKIAVIPVKRDSPEARKQSVRDIKKMLLRNISVVIAPEGTFNMTHKPLKDFYDGAFRISIETETPIQPVVILDAYDRMSHRSIFSITPGRSRAVFLAPTWPQQHDVPLLKEKVFKQMEAEIMLQNASWIKNSD